MLELDFPIATHDGFVKSPISALRFITLFSSCGHTWLRPVDYIRDFLTTNRNRCSFDLLGMPWGMPHNLFRAPGSPSGQADLRTRASATSIPLHRQRIGAYEANASMSRRIRMANTSRLKSGELIILFL
jgi:hypothetical protein